jgi:cytochrome c oxidase assembly factor CtaG
MLLLFIVPLLLLLARPFEPIARLMGKPATTTFVRATRPLHLIAHPAVALTIFVATLWLTHFTGLYEAALQHWPVHVAEHLLYLLAGTCFWLPVVAPPPLRPLPFPARLLYLAIALPQGALLAMAIDSARMPLYPHYVAIEGWRGALADQSNSAAVMWICGGLVVFVAFLATLGIWARRESVAGEGNYSFQEMTIFPFPGNAAPRSSLTAVAAVSTYEEPPPPPPLSAAFVREKPQAVQPPPPPPPP